MRRVAVGLLAAGGCGGAGGAIAGEAGVPPGAMDAGARVPLEAHGDGYGYDAAPDATAMADVLPDLDATTAPDAAPCSVGTASATVNGATVAFSGCTGFEWYYSPGAYASLEIDCPSPRLGIGVLPDGGSPTLSYVPSGSTTVYTGTVSLTVTALGGVGGFIDGTVSVPDLRPRGQTSPTTAFQGSFHVCRTADMPLSH